jgi:hypothetical protein
MEAYGIKHLLTNDRSDFQRFDKRVKALPLIN